MARQIFLSSDGRLRAGWRILVFLLVFFSLAILLQFGIKAWAGGVPKTSPYLRNAILILLTATAATLAVPIARRYLDKKTFASLGLRAGGRAGGDLAFGFLLSGAMAAAFLGLLALTGLGSVEGLAWNVEPQDAAAFGALAIYLAKISLGSLAFFLLMDVVVGWWEELVFRGYLFQNLVEGLRLPGAILLSCVLYGILHAANPNAGLISTLLIMGFGYLRIYGYLLTGQLWLSMGMHVGWNYFQGHIFGFAASGQDTPSLFVLQLRGPDWLSGGDFGPEGSLLVIPILGLACLAMRWWSAGRLLPG